MDMPASIMPRKGRGAGSNESGRFESEKRVAFDDGWGATEAEPARRGVRVIQRQDEIPAPLRRGGSGEKRRDRTLPAGHQAAIGMQEQQPFAACQGCTGRQLGAAAGRPGDDVCAGGARDRDRGVPRPAVADDDLVNQPRSDERRQRLRQFAGGVERRDHYRYRISFLKCSHRRPIIG